MGAERTLMAWVRTSLSMISFGFTIYKFLHDLSKAENSRVPDHGPRNFGLALVGLGSIVLIMASIQYLRRMHDLRGESLGGKKFPLAFFVAIAIAALGVLAFLDIWLQVGPF